MKSSLKSRICALVESYALDFQIQGNMPGNWYSVYMTDAVRPGYEGHKLYSGGGADTLAFLQGYGAYRYHHVITAHKDTK